MKIPKVKKRPELIVVKEELTTIEVKRLIQEAEKGPFVSSSTLLEKMKKWTMLPEK